MVHVFWVCPDFCAVMVVALFWVFQVYGFFFKVSMLFRLSACLVAQLQMTCVLHMRPVSFGTVIFIGSLF